MQTSALSCSYNTGKHHQVFYSCVFGPPFIINLVILRQIRESLFSWRTLISNVYGQIKFYELQAALLKPQTCILYRKDNDMFWDFYFY